MPEVDSQSQSGTERNFSLKVNKISFKRCFKEKHAFRVVSNNCILLETPECENTSHRHSGGVRRDGCNSYSVAKLLSACIYLIFYHNIPKPPSLFYSLCPPSNFSLISSPFHFPHITQSLHSPSSLLPHLSTIYYIHSLFLLSSLFLMSFIKP